VNKEFNTDIKALSKKILDGINQAVKELIEKSAMQNESLIVEGKNGKIEDVPAKELLKTLPQK
jgi:hypothetical protein